MYDWYDGPGSLPDRKQIKMRMEKAYHRTMKQLIHQQIFTMRINNAQILLNQGNVEWADQNFDIAKKFLDEVEKLHTSYSKPDLTNYPKGSSGRMNAERMSLLGNYDCSQTFLQKRTFLPQPCFIPIWIDYAKKMLNQYMTHINSF